jgi:nucleotide-binding universal stress UspA family protein
MIGTRQSTTERATPTVRTGADVLMAADGSAAGPQIASEIASWAAPPAEVIVLTVLPHEAKPDGSPRAQQDHDRRVEAMTRDTLAVLREAGVNARVDVTYGAPGEAIVQYANECSPRVILVGRRGAGLTKRLLGSVSEHVVANARQPVTVVG